MLKLAPVGADLLVVGRSVIGLCSMAGLTMGGVVPDLWGGGSFSLASIVFSVLGGTAGVWLGVRLSS